MSNKTKSIILVIIMVISIGLTSLNIEVSNNVIVSTLALIGVFILSELEIKNKT
jgi:hypothetical protein